MYRGPALMLEVAFNGLILVLGIAVCVAAVRLGFGGLALPGAGLFPFFAGLIIVIAQSVVMVRAALRRYAQAEFESGKHAFARLAALVAIFAGWILAMPYLGYILVTFAAVLAFAKVLGLEGWWRPLALSAGTSVAIYVLFDRLLYLDLPRGLLG